MKSEGRLHLKQNNLHWRERRVYIGEFAKQQKKGKGKEGGIEGKK